MNDFDFLIGSWDIANRRLTKALAGSTEWYEFPATSEAVRLLGGLGNMDEMSMPILGFSGVTVRLFDESPVVGRFVDGAGTFYGDDTHEGQPIRVRFLWSKITPTSAHWEQAFSADGEKTWETNWMIDLTRRL
jgi:hypothetical protein